MKHLTIFVLSCMISCVAAGLYAQEEMVMEGELVEINDEVYTIQFDDSQETRTMICDFNSMLYINRQEVTQVEMFQAVLPMPVTVYYYYVNGSYFIDTLFATRSDPFSEY